MGYCVEETVLWGQHCEGQKEQDLEHPVQVRDAYQKSLWHLENYIQPWAPPPEAFTLQV